MSAVQIDTALVQQFNGNFQMLSQQKASRLMPASRVETLSAEFAYFDQIGSVEAKERTSRHQDTAFTEVPFSRRKVGARDFEMSEILDSQDRMRMLGDPTSDMVRAFAAGMGRKIDDVWMSSFFGNAMTGKDGSTTVAFTSGNQIAVDYVESGSATNSNLTVAKLRQAKYLLDQAEAGVDPDEKRFIAAGALEIKALLRSVEVTSSDFNVVKALVQGEVNTFMGFNFIRTERIIVNGSSNRRIPAWVQSGMLVAVGQTPSTIVLPDVTKGGNNRIITKATFGATRMEEAKCVEIICHPTTL